MGRTSPLGSRRIFFARKLSLNPSAINNADVNELIAHFGPDRSLDVIWWTSRCHYMTRVADAFQLPLESENVFAPSVPAPSAQP